MSRATPTRATPVTYDEIEQPLEVALAEVRHRIRNNVQIF